MNFSSMEYFIALAEERSFTRAAQRLMVTQQTLSAHIAAWSVSSAYASSIARCP